MATITGACSILMILLLHSSLLPVVHSNARYGDLYVDGVASYFDGDWGRSTETLEKSMAQYKAAKEAREKCYVKCASEPVDMPDDYEAVDEEVRFFHTVLQGAACRHKCKKASIEGFGWTAVGEGGISHKIENDMTSGEVHNYIQHSLYQMKEVSKAAQNAATHFYLNPNSNTARSNIHFYRSIAEEQQLSENDFNTLVSKRYRDLYVEGQALYKENEYEKMVEKFEESLIAFYEEIEKCRVECEGPQKFTDSNHFPAAMWQVHLSYLQCLYDCPDKLGRFRGEDEDVHFLGSFFHYLTYGYFHLDRMREAAAVVTTQLRIEPNNKIAIMNKGYIKQQPGVTIKDFVEREDARWLLDRMDKEREVLNMIRELYEDDEEMEREEDKDNEALLEEDFRRFPIEKASEEKKEEVEKDEAKEEVKEEVKENEKEEVKEDTKRDDSTSEDTLTVVETAADHGGVERVLVDGLLTEDQCQTMLKLTQNCKEGDGYQRKSPHTPHEKFEGLTVLDAAKGVVSKQIEHEQVQLYVNVSTAVKNILVQQFNLSKTLYFSYTHLVCRTAKPSSSIVDRRDLSHPVHADNCVQEKHNGECYKQAPAYTWRDYSAIVYLNDDFDGGKFFFAHSPYDTTPQHYVTPKCGRMVGFSAGKENMHGVTAITSGKRCAIALWLTLDPNYSETTFDEALTLLKGA